MNKKWIINKYINKQVLNVFFFGKKIGLNNGGTQTTER